MLLLYQQLRKQFTLVANSCSSYINDKYINLLFFGKPKNNIQEKLIHRLMSLVNICIESTFVLYCICIGTNYLYEERGY